MNEIKAAVEELGMKEQSQQSYSVEIKKAAKSDSLEKRYSFSNGTINHKESSDEELVRSFVKSRNEDAFNKLVNRYTDKIYRLALRITRNHTDAEDVLQEVFLNLLDKVSTFREESKLSTWLYRITVNTSLIHLRVQKKYKSSVSLDDYVPYDEDGSLKGIEVRDWSNMPDEVIASKQTMEMVEKAIDDMPEKYRVVFELRDVEGLSNQEVAEVLGLTVPAVKSRVLRSRLFLRDKLSDYLYESRK